MSPLVPSILATLAGTVVLSWLYSHLYRVDRERYLGCFALAWLAASVRHGGELASALGAGQAWAAWTTLAVPAFAWLLLEGTLRFQGKRSSGSWIALALAAAWGIGALARGASPIWLSPMHLVAGLTIVWGGTTLFETRKGDRGRHWVAGGACISLGVQIAVRPLVPWSSNHWFHVLRATLEVLVAVGILLIYLERMRLALRENAALLQGVLDRSGSMVAVKDIEGRYLFVNQPFAERTGFAVEKLLGRRPRELWTAELATAIEERDKHAIESRAVQHRDEKLEEHTYHVVTFPLNRADGSPFGVASVYSDITEHQRVDERIHAEGRREALGTLARGVVHDLNNLLTVIAAHVAELAQKLPGDGDVQEIRGALSRGEGLAGNLLAFSSRQRLSPKALELDRRVEAARPLIEHIAGTDIAVEMTSEPCRVQADPEQIELVLANLALNSAHAMPEGGKIVVATSLVDVDSERARTNDVAPGAYAMIAFRDTGSGMSASTRERVFEPFFTTQPKGSGAGLGLASVYGVVHQSGGFIEVDSEIGKGTEIRVLLPVAEDRDQLSSDKLRIALPIERSESSTILLAEDEPAVRRVVARALKSNGYTVVQAVDGEDALRRAQAIPERIALVITDVEMPRMGGVELADHLTELRPGTPVLFISGYTDAIDRIARGQPGRDFLQKPFEPATLMARVASLIGAELPDSEVRARETPSSGNGGARRSSS